MKIPMKKTHCSYCDSESITEVQYDENFENFKAASKYAWIGLTDEEREEAVEVCLHAGVEAVSYWIEDILKERNT